MDELTEEELKCLQRSAKPWYKLPDTCTYQGYPLYLKLCTDGHEDDKNNNKSTLIVLLTDIRSSVWLEYFGEWRAIHIRIKVSARETPKSTYADLNQNDAVLRLLSGLEDYTNVKDSTATIDSKSDSEMELILHLAGLSFRLRLDKVSPVLQTRLLFDLVYTPLLGVMNTAQGESNVHLPSMQSALDKKAKGNTEETMKPELLSAMQRFSQTKTGVASKQRVAIADLAETTVEGDVDNNDQDMTEDAQPEHTESNEPTSEADPDKTIDSSPEAKPPTSSTGKSKTTDTLADADSETIAGGPASNTRAAASPTPSMDIEESAPMKTRGKRKSQVVNSPSLEGADSEATQESEEGEQENNGRNSHVTQNLPESKKKPRSSKGRRTSKSPEPPQTEKTPAESTVEKEKGKKKTRAVTPERAQPERTEAQVTSPAAPVLKRPAAGTARGAAPKRGRRPGMQWSNFG